MPSEDFMAFIKKSQEKNAAKDGQAEHVKAETREEAQSKKHNEL